MTKTLSLPKTIGIGILFLAAVIALLPAIRFQETAFAHPSIGEDLGYPTNDCGKNWTLFLRFTADNKNNTCVIGSIDASIVKKQVEALRATEPPPEPGEIRTSGLLDQVLRAIAEKWLGR